MKTFTDKGIAALKPPAEGLAEYRDPALPGFGIRVSARGTKTFFLARRVLREGKRVKSRISLGRYPTIKLADARVEARRLAVGIDGTADPIAEKAAALAKITEDSANTFAKAVKGFMKDHVAENLRPGTALQYKYALQGADTAAWRDRPITSITKHDIRALLKGMKERGVTTGANRTLAYLKVFFRWCAEEDLIETPPTVVVTKPHEEVSRARVLRDGELVEVWTGTAALPVRPRLALRALLLTAQRRGEVAGMRWAELEELGTDEPVWALPADRTKNKRAHRVPLSPNMIDLIENAREQETGEFVFGAGTKPLWLGGKIKQQLDTTIAANRLAAGVTEPMPHWTFHDLRRTAATNMHETLNVEPHVVEAVLNHYSGHKAGVAGVYNRSAYNDQKRDALDRWAARVDLLLRQAAGENVVSLGTTGSA